MNKTYFKPSEYIIRPDIMVPVDVQDKILVHHIMPMNVIRHALEAPIVVSLNSGYRPPEHENEKGRTKLTSTHLFREIPERKDPGYGAADYRPMIHKWGKFIELMVQKSPYTRIAFYPEMETPFVHTDYRFYGIEKYYYIVTSGTWNRVSKFELIDTVKKKFL